MVGNGDTGFTAPDWLRDGVSCIRYTSTSTADWTGGNRHVNVEPVKIVGHRCRECEQRRAKKKEAKRWTKVELLGEMERLEREHLLKVRAIRARLGVKRREVERDFIQVTRHLKVVQERHQEEAGFLTTLRIKVNDLERELDGYDRSRGRDVALQEVSRQFGEALRKIEKLEAKLETQKKPPVVEKKADTKQEPEWTNRFQKLEFE